MACNVRLNPAYCNAISWALLEKISQLDKVNFTGFHRNTQIFEVSLHIRSLNLIS